MLGRTHFFVGMTSALAIMQPESLPILVAGTGAAALGGVISDIDSGTSQAHKDADKVMGASVLTIAVISVLEWYFHLGITHIIMENSDYFRIVCGILLFLLICSYGMRQPHRAFMHSFAALFTLSGCVAMIFPDIMPYFAIGFISHLFIDLFNRRNEKLLWPMKKGYCMHLCSSKGIVNRMLLTISIIAAIILIYESIPVQSAILLVRK